MKNSIWFASFFMFLIGILMLVFHYSKMNIFSVLYCLCLVICGFGFLLCEYANKKIFNLINEKILYYYFPIITLSNTLIIFDIANKGFFFNNGDERIAAFAALVAPTVMVYLYWIIMEKIIIEGNSTRKKLLDFSSCLIITILEFTKMNVYVYTLNPEAFKGINNENTVSILIDIFIYTFQNIGLQNLIQITPVSNIAKLIYLLQIIFYAIFVFIVLLQIVNGLNKTNSNK